MLAAIKSGVRFKILRNRELELSTGAVLPVSKCCLEDLQRRMVSYFSGR